MISFNRGYSLLLALTIFMASLSSSLANNWLRGKQQQQQQQKERIAKERLYIGDEDELFWSEFTSGKIDSLAPTPSPVEPPSPSPTTSSPPVPEPTTSAPVVVPTQPPTATPTTNPPTASPVTTSPTSAPTVPPTTDPTEQPTVSATSPPTGSPVATASPTTVVTPTQSPTVTTPAPTTSTPTISIAPTITAAPTITSAPTITASPTITSAPTITAVPTITGAPTVTANPTATSVVPPPTSVAPSPTTVAPTISSAPTITASPTTTTSPTFTGQTSSPVVAPPSSSPVSEPPTTPTLAPTMVNPLPSSPVAPPTTATPTAGPTAATPPSSAPVSEPPTTPTLAPTMVNPLPSSPVAPPTTATPTEGPTAATPPSSAPVSEPPTTPTLAPTMVNPLPSSPVAPPSGPITPTLAPTMVNPLPSSPVEPPSAPTPATPSPTMVNPLPSSPVAPSIAPTPSLPPSSQTLSPSSSGTEVCSLNLTTTCIPPLGATSCNDIPSIETQCTERPTSMTFRFNGGGCEGSSNEQPPTFSQCQDSNGGPPSSEGIVSRIIVSSINGDREFFDGLVAIGDTYTFSSLNADNIRITVFSASDTDVQTVTLHTSCAIQLTLKDQFGGHQLVEFTNESQGTVNGIYDATLVFAIDGPDGEENEAVLSALVVAINTNTGVGGGIKDLSDQVDGIVVSQGNTIQTNTTIMLDLTEKTTYTVLSTVTGMSPDAVACQGADQFEFIAGNELSPSSPTEAPGPTEAPSVVATESLSPTPDPETAPCNITAAISCDTADSEGCTFSSPVGKTCIGSSATELRFIYLSEDRCNGNNTQSSFECMDENTDIALPFTVWIRVFLGGATFYDGIVNEGNIFAVPIFGNANSVEIQISTVNDAADGPGSLLQSSSMSVRCQEEDAITLLDTFGSLQLVGYRNAEQGLEIVYAGIVIRYLATNDGLFDALLTGALKTNPFSGMESLLTEGEQILLMPDDTTAFSDSFTLNLAAAVGQELQFDLLIQGQGAASGVECGSSDSITLFVEP